MDRVQIKAQGKAAMQKNYGMCILAAFLISFAAGGSGVGFAGVRFSQTGNFFNNGDMSSEQMVAFITVAIIIAAIVCLFVVIGVLIGAFLIKPLQIGGDAYFLSNLYETPNSSLLGVGYKNNWMRNSITMLLVDIFTFLWSLLFIIPGIIAGYSYRFVPYILAENPDIKPMDAIKLSKQMMNGHKWEAFVFDLSFLGWNILGLFTFGILSLVYVNPYYQSSCAAYYNAVKLSTTQPVYPAYQPPVY